MDEVMALLEAQVAAWNRGDLTAFMAAYADDVSFTSGGQVQRGREATHARYVERYGAGPLGELGLVPLETRLVGEAAAFVLGRFRLAGQEIEPARGVFSLVLEKRAAGWCIVHDHTTVG
jgi:uncharacterized protein (TIGR02246 family)